MTDRLRFSRRKYLARLSFDWQTVHELTRGEQVSLLNAELAMRDLVTVGLAEREPQRPGRPLRYRITDLGLTAVMKTKPVEAPPTGPV